MREPPAPELLEQVSLEAYVEGAYWIARVASILAGVRRLDRDMIATRRADCVADQDAWGTGMADLACAITCIQLGEWRLAAEEASRAADIFDALQAQVLAMWSHVIALHAEPYRAQQRRRAAELERRARVLGLPGARALALAAGSSGDRLHAEELARDCGLDSLVQLPVRKLAGASRADRTIDASGSSDEMTSDVPDVVVRCFGAFQLAVGTREVSLSSLRPKARALLHFLSLNSGKPVHREVILDKLWPEQSPDTALHGLHVAVSALRRTLEPDAKRGEAHLIVRAGDSYSFAVAAGSHVDVLEFDNAITAGNAARRRGEADDARRLLSRALSLYVDELLPEDGPADWVVEPREQRRHAAAEAAAAIAELSMASHDLASAIDAAMNAVRLDPLSDSGWRHLTEAHRRAGDLAAAEQASRQHRQVLVELGVVVPEQRPRLRR
jgi:DNA-binding SARP family transcriptional activator